MTVGLYNLCYLLCWYWFWHLAVYVTWREATYRMEKAPTVINYLFYNTCELLTYSTPVNYCVPLRP